MVLSGRHLPCSHKNSVSAREDPADPWSRGWTGVKRRLGAVALALGLCAGMAEPARAASPTGTLEAFFARANTILQSVHPFESLEGPRQAIRDLVNEAFDFRGAAAAALGSVWLSRVPEDQDAFARLFAVFLGRGFIAAIGSRASITGGISIHYLGESLDGEAAAVSTMLLTRSGQEMSVVYRMVHRGDSWKVQDVVVDGVSLVLNYRAQFARILTASPYAELLARMRREAALESPPSAPGDSESRYRDTVPALKAAPLY